MQEKGLVSNYGIFTTLVVTIVGVGAFSFPRGVAYTVGSDGWIVVLLSGIICFIFAYVMYKSTVFNSYKDINSILEDSFGRVIGVILAVVFAAFIVFYIGLSMRVFIEVVKVYLLEKTPTEFLILITILTATYLIRGEFDSLLKFNEISFWVMFISIFLVLLFTLNVTDFSNVLPVFTKSPGVYISSIKYTMFSFTGFEVVYMLMPRAKNKDKLGKVLFMSIAFVTVFYALLYIFVIAVFNKNEASILIWPTITMIKSIDIPGSFIERWEGVVMTLWIIFFFTTFTNVYYFSSDIVKKAFRLNDIRISLLLIIPFLYLIAMYPENIARVYDLLKYTVPPTGVVVYIVLPLLLLIIGRRRRKGDGSGSVV
jgi:spore germination protein